MTPAELIARVSELGGRIYLADDDLRLKAPKDKLPPELIRELKRQKVALISFLRAAQNSSAESTPAIAAVSRDRDIPVTFAQQRLWFLDQLDPGNPVYNISPTYRLKGELDVAALEDGFNSLVRRQEVLRTCFATIDDVPYQKIVADLKVEIKRHDASESSPQELAEKIEAIRNTRFKLDEAPLLEMHLIAESEHNHILCIPFHHSICDGWSLDIFFRELLHFYAENCGVAVPELPALSRQYADFAHWQRQHLRGTELERQLAYWREHLTGAPPLLQLATDRPRPRNQSNNGARVRRLLPRPLFDALNDLARRNSATINMVLMAAVNLLLARHSGQDDIVLGTPVAGRQHTEVESVIGFFINTLAIRSDLAGDPVFTDLLAQLKRNTLQAYAHQEMPFEKIVETLNPDRDMSHTPVFQVMFNYHNEPWGSKTFHGLEVEDMSIGGISAKFDITFAAAEWPDGLFLNLEYNTDLFDEQRIERLVDDYHALLDAIVANAEQPLSALIRSLTAEANPVPDALAADKNRPEFANVVAAFEYHAASHPNRLAVQAIDIKQDYGELNGLANQVAHALLTLEIHCGDRVGLLLGHDAQMIAGLLGTLKSGASYVPLDPHWPALRLQRVAADAQLSAVVCVSELAEQARQVAGAALPCVEVDRVGDNKSSNPEIEINPDAVAYILFTSGSTGTPKGVTQSHRNLCRNIEVYAQALKLQAEDRLTLFSSYAVDASLQDIFGAFSTGASVHPIDLRMDISPQESCVLIASEKLSVIHCTPTVFRYLYSSGSATEQPIAARLLVLGGEAARQSDWECFRELFPDTAAFVNGYGLTELTVAAQYFADQQASGHGATLPVGKPVDGTDICLMDRKGTPSAICGEVQLCSPYLSTGYWNDAEQNAAVFSSDASGRRTFRSGDFAKFLANGQLQLLGRKDGQLKIRGNRIESGEIEALLTENTDVREVAIELRQDDPDNPQLVAYISGRPNATLDGNTIREELAKQLPAYMVPAAIIVLDELPLTPTGKVDRKALPAPTWASDASRFVAPRTAEEEGIARIWCDILAVDKVGIHDDFFSLGGHSLLTIKLVREIEKITGKRPSIASVFEGPTIEQIARALNDSAADEVTDGHSVVLPIKTSGSRKPLFFIDGEPMRMAKSVSADQPLYGVYHAYDQTFRPPDSLVDLATVYLREIKKVQPEGPYYIVGFCVGALAGFEVARQLIKGGDKVAYLSLIDPTIPGRYANKLDWVKQVFAYNNKLKAIGFLTKRAFTSAYARMGLAQRLLRGWVYSKLGLELPIRLRHVRNAGRIRESHSDYRYSQLALAADIYLADMAPDNRAAHKQFWVSVFKQGVKISHVEGLTHHGDFLKEPYISDITREIDEHVRNGYEANLNSENIEQ